MKFACKLIHGGASAPLEQIETRIKKQEILWKLKGRALHWPNWNGLLPQLHVFEHFVP